MANDAHIKYEWVTTMCFLYFYMPLRHLPSNMARLYHVTNSCKGPTGILYTAFRTHRLSYKDKVYHYLLRSKGLAKRKHMVSMGLGDDLRPVTS